MSVLDIIAQVIGVIAILANIYAVQKNTHFKIMFYKTVGSLLFALQYLLLGAYSGMVMDVIGSARNIVFAERVKRKQSNIPFIIFFVILTVILGVLTIYFSWQDSLSKMDIWSSLFSVQLFLVILMSILSIFAKVISCISYGIDNPHIIRILNLISSICWIFYNFTFKSITGVFNEILVIASIIIAEIRFRKKVDVE